MKSGKYSKEEENLIRELYPKMYAKEIACVLGRSVISVYQKANAIGMKAPAERIREAGRIGAGNEAAIAHRFKRGHIPANKGVKMSDAVYAKVAHTMFKKGNRPKNYKPVGSERVSVDGYVEIKVAEPRQWKMKHRVIWEQYHGEIPRGCNIQFKNRNPLDCSIDNLYIIDRATQMREENSYMARYPKELQDVIRLKGAVNRQINKRIRKKDE